MNDKVHKSFDLGNLTLPMQVVDDNSYPSI
jgi:hypothetical protein